jgi:serine/threonine protein kinase
VIHRDLKPGNILFDEHDNAYLSDFDIAKLTQSGHTLPPGGIVGTPTHMSPEQARGEDVDGRSDIYSLGVIMFEMLSGRMPYEARTPLGLALKHAAYPVPRILSLNPNLPPSIEAVNEKVLAKERNKRYGSGLEFANAFVAALSESYTADRKLVATSPLHAKPDPQALILPPPNETPQRPSLDLG